jgi:hypothetical protein
MVLMQCGFVVERINGLIRFRTLFINDGSSAFNLLIEDSLIILSKYFLKYVKFSFISM